MATVNKDFKVKHGLVVEGATGTINGEDILTKAQADQDYIIGLIGGSATSEATADTVVLRDANADFAANDITVNELSIKEMGRIYEDDGDLIISNTDESDVIIEADDIRLNATDDIRLTSGTGSDIVLSADSGVIRFEAPNIYAGENLQYVDSEKVATRGYVDDEISGLDLTFTSDEITEGSTNLYYTDARARGAIAAGTGIDYNSSTGYIDANLGTGLGLDGSSQIEIDRTTVDAWYDAAGDADAAETAANAYTDDLIGDATVDGTAGNTVTARIATAVSDLVGSAPELLDTLQELAAALDDNPDVISDLQDVAAGKQDALTAGANIDITGATISVTGLDSEDISDFNTAALSATSTAYDAAGTAQDIVDALDTDDIEEGSTNLYFTNQRAIDAVGGTIGDAIDALDTDDIEEGSTNRYFTDQRAKEVAATLLSSSDQTNISITQDPSGNLTIVAENGVADSDTDDLTEGTSNLYFTDQRAIDALQNTTPTFTAVDINSIAKQVAATVSAPTGGSQITAYSFAKADYRSAKFLVKTAYGSHTELSEVLITLDSGDNIAITEYAIVGTNGSSMAVTADIDGTNVRLRVTPVNNDSTVTVMGTLLV